MPATKIEQQVNDLIGRTRALIMRRMPQFEASDGLLTLHDLKPEVFLPRLNEIAGKTFTISQILAYPEAALVDYSVADDDTAALRELVDDTAVAHDLYAEWTDLLRVATMLSRATEGQERLLGLVPRSEDLILTHS